MDHADSASFINLSVMEFLWYLPTIIVMMIFFGRLIWILRYSENWDDDIYLDIILALILTVITWYANQICVELLFKNTLNI